MKDFVSKDSEYTALTSEVSYLSNSQYNTYLAMYAAVIALIAMASIMGNGILASLSYLVLLSFQASINRKREWWYMINAYIHVFYENEKNLGWRKISNRLSKEKTQNKIIVFFARMGSFILGLITLLSSSYIYFRNPIATGNLHIAISCIFMLFLILATIFLFWMNTKAFNAKVFDNFVEKFKKEKENEATSDNIIDDISVDETGGQTT